MWADYHVNRQQRIACITTAKRSQKTLLTQVMTHLIQEMVEVAVVAEAQEAAEVEVLVAMATRTSPPETSLTDK